MAEVRPRSDLRFFFWMPKTAGGTLAAGIRSNPGVQWPTGLLSPGDLPAPSSDQVWFGGHMAFGLHLIYNAEPAYFTVLRDPIDRLISEFFYHHQHPLPGIFIPDDEIVPAFIRLVEGAKHLNYYSYMFSDYCFVKESAATGGKIWDGDSAAALDLIAKRDRRYGFLSENVPFEQVDVDEAFRRALRSLALMRFVGFFDQLGDAKRCLKREFGLRVGLDHCVHKTKWKPRLEDLPGHVAKMLVSKTEADYEFFRSAREAPAAGFLRRRLKAALPSRKAQRGQLVRGRKTAWQVAQQYLSLHRARR
jgi:hypothetical protein